MKMPAERKQKEVDAVRSTEYVGTQEWTGQTIVDERGVLASGKWGLSYRGPPSRFVPGLRLRGSYPYARSSCPGAVWSEERLATGQFTSIITGTVASWQPA